MSRKPRTRRSILRIKVIAEILRGTKFPRTIARPDILPTDTWLGIRKKKTAAANLKTLLTNKRQYMVGKIQIPSIPLCDGAVYISGDSMYPILKSGDIVGFKEINSFSNLIYGEMYLVSFTIEGDEYLAVKYVNRSEKEGCLKLVSYNAHHDPMDIPFSTINAMAIVKFSIRRHMMM